MDRYAASIVVIVLMVFFVALFKVSFTGVSLSSSDIEIAGKASQATINKITSIKTENVDCFDMDMLTKNPEKVPTTVLVNQEGVTFRISDVCIGNTLKEVICSSSGHEFNKINCKDFGLNCLNDEKGIGYCG